MRAAVVSSDIITAYGIGTDACWRGLLSGRPAISKVERFDAKAFHSDVAATVNGLEYHGKESLCAQMLKRLFTGPYSAIPGDTMLILATAKGEIDLLEKSMLKGEGAPEDSRPGRLLEKVSGITGLENAMFVISAACASGSTAIARAAAMICSGWADSVLIAACDAVTEFVYSGFSSLMALDKTGARPFDRTRGGLSLGEAAGFVLLMNEERAIAEKREIKGYVEGWGLTDDSNHMTGPCRDAKGMINAIGKAMASASVTPEEIDMISAHGTGTVYNDAMELKAFGNFFKESVPIYSLKGAVGHTLGAAGLIEAVVGQRALKERLAPPTIGFEVPEQGAEGRVSSAAQEVRKGGSRILLVNAGFTGVNAAIVLS